MGFRLGARWHGKAALLFVAVAGAATLLAGCGKPPVAVVNGVALTDDQFQQLCANTVLTNPQQASVGLITLQEWVRGTVLAELAKKQGVYPTQQDLDRRIHAVESYSSVAGKPLKDQLSTLGMTLEAFRQQQLRNMVAENLNARGVTATDDEIKQAFERAKRSMTIPATASISQITVDNEKDLKRVRDDLATNAQFGIVAKSYSKDRFAQNGGKIPAQLAKGQTVPAGGPVAQQVLDTAFKLKPTQVSDPIKMGASWVIVRLDDLTPEKQPNLDDVKDIIRSQVLQQKAQSSGKAQENQKAINDAYASARLEVNRPEYKTFLTSFQRTQQAMQQMQTAPGANMMGSGGGVPTAPGG